MPDIKFLFLDLGGVLILKKDVDWEKFDDQYSLRSGKARAIFQDCYHKQSTGEDFDLHSYFTKNYSDILAWSDFKKIRKEVFRSEIVNKPLLDWIEKQKDDYTIALLTNNTAALEILLEFKFEIKHIFDHIFNSAEIGFIKPDKRFFKYVLKKLDADAKQCLFIDDTKKHLLSAQELGFRTFLFKNNKEFFNSNF